MTDERIRELLGPFASGEAQILMGDVPDWEYPAVHARFEEWQELRGYGYIRFLADPMYDRQSNEHRLYKAVASITEDGAAFLANVA